MEFLPYIRRPFTVKAVQITEDNFEEIAAKVGIIEENDQGRFITVDRRVVPNAPRVYLGWYLTDFDGSYRAYSKKVFKKLFVDFEESVTFTFPKKEKSKKEAEVSTD